MTPSVIAPPLKCRPAPLPLPYLVNSVAISDDGSRVIGGTFYYPYKNTVETETHGTYGTYAVEWATGKRLWADEYFGCQGVFAVAISGDGTVAAGGGLLTDKAGGVDGKYQGLLRAYCACCGRKLLDYTGIVSAGPGSGRVQRVSWVALSADGKVLGAVADKVYVFVRDGECFPDQPSGVITFPDGFNDQDAFLPTAVAIHPSGKWLVACDKGGNVCLAMIAGGKLQQPIYRWKAPKPPIDRSKPTGPDGYVVFLSIAISRNGDSFVAGGNDYVYYFTLDEMRQNQAPVTSYDTWVQPPPAPPQPAPPAPAQPVAAAPQIFAPQNVRWVAISGDGSLVTAVMNRNKAAQNKGSLVALKYANKALTLAWEHALSYNPNSTGVDAAATRVVASDGWPFGTPGTFHCFDPDGSPRWSHPTQNMNWPLVISSNGAAIAGGGDDGLLYCFTP